MPARAAQVFGPITATFNASTTGLKSLTTITTSLPAGANVIIVLVEPTTASAAVVWRMIVRRGTTNLLGSDVLYSVTTIAGQESEFKKFTHIFYDPSAGANQSYDILANVTTAGSTNVSVALTVLVVNFPSSGEVSANFVGTEVSVAAGATASVNSVTIDVGKYVIFAVWNYRHGSAVGATLNAGNIRLKINSTILSSIEFPTYNRTTVHPTAHAGLIAVVDSSGTSTISLEVVNNTSQTLYFISSLVAIWVADYLFVDTTSVAIGTSETTIGSQNVTFNTDYAVFAFLTVNNTTTIRPTIEANAARLYAGTTVVMSNYYPWAIEASSNFFNTNSISFFHVNNVPATYTIRATAPTTGLNSEAKILAVKLSTGLDIKKVINEQLRLQELPSGAMAMFRAISEVLNINDVHIRSQNVFKSIGEVLGLNEIAVRSRRMGLVFAELISIPEVTIRLRNRIRSFVETVRLSETKIGLRALFKSFVERVNVGEVSSRARSLVRVLVEQVRLSEAVVRARALSRLVIENIRLVENRLLSRGKSFAFVEHLNIGETKTRLRSLFRTVVEGMNILESLRMARNWVRIKTEGMNIGEVVLGTRRLFRQLNELVNISMLSTVIRGRVLAIVESLRMVESTKSLRGLVRMVVEPFRVFESRTISRQMVRLFNELVGVVEDVKRTMAIFLSFIENVRIVESFIQFRGFVLAVVENVRILESRLFKVFKTYIKKLVSSLRGRAKGDVV